MSFRSSTVVHNTNNNNESLYWPRQENYWGSWVQTPQEAIFCHFKNWKKYLRSWQGSNLRGQSPLDFKSNALTTRPQLQCYQIVTKSMWRCGGSNPGPFTCKANALPLSYIPSVMNYIKSTTKQTRLVFFSRQIVAVNICLRPYHVENTSSRPITEVKQH